MISITPPSSRSMAQIAFLLASSWAELCALSISAYAGIQREQGITLWTDPSFLLKRLTTGYVYQPFSLAALEPPSQESRQDGLKVA